MICPHCGIEFEPHRLNQKHCSEKCRRKTKEKRYRALKKARPDYAHTPRQEQIRYTCANACGGCSWSRKLKPIPGWDAEPTILMMNNGATIKPMQSFKILRCPEYRQEPARRTVVHGCGPEKPIITMAQPKPKESMAKVNEKARAMGMSYGQYVSWRASNG